MLGHVVPATADNVIYIMLHISILKINGKLENFSKNVLTCKAKAAGNYIVVKTRRQAEVM